MRGRESGIERAPEFRLALDAVSDLPDDCLKSELVIVWRGLLGHDGLAWLREQVAVAESSDLTHPTGSTELQVLSPKAWGVLQLLLNAPGFLGEVGRLSGVEVKRFEGHFYRMDPRSAHRGEWHNDATGGRCLALSVNIGDSFEGGELLLRRRGQEELSARVRNAGPGDAVLFPISLEFEHRVRSVEGDAPKVAFAGWFFEDMDFARSLRARSLEA